MELLRKSGKRRGRTKQIGKEKHIVREGKRMKSSKLEKEKEEGN